jgi:hypothetical protein
MSNERVYNKSMFWPTYDTGGQSVEMQDIWRSVCVYVEPHQVFRLNTFSFHLASEYTPLFCQALTAGFPVLAPCSAFWPGDGAYSSWQTLLKMIQLDRRSRDILLDRLFRHVELRCGHPSDRQAIEAFRASPFRHHASRTEMVYIFVGYVYGKYTREVQGQRRSS